MADRYVRVCVIVYGMVYTYGTIGLTLPGIGTVVTAVFGLPASAATTLFCDMNAQWFSSFILNIFGAVTMTWSC